MADFGKLNFSVSFNRTSAFPLEANSYFNNYTEAEQAAQTAVEPGSADSAYYIGQTLTVADETDCNLYIIKPDQSLKILTNQDTSDVAWESILNKPTTIGGYGITDAYTKTECDTRFFYINHEDLDPNTYDGYYTGMTTKSGIDTNWWHIISTNWDNSNEGITGNKTWASQLALPTQNRKGLRYRSGNGESAYWQWVKVWDESNDGNGSGLDADLLDGKHYTDIVNGNVSSATKLQTPRTIWGQSFDGTNNIDGDFLSNGNIRLLNRGELQMLNTEGGNWYIGYGAGGNKSFNLFNRTSGYYLRCINGNVAIGGINPSQKLHVAGNILATGFYEESDVQLKTNIQPIDFTNNIELVSFNWKKDGSKSYGVIAQQVEQYYPELVSTDESTGYKSVNYDAVLIIKCAQLENRIKQLEKELEDLKNE